MSVELYEISFGKIIISLYELTAGKVISVKSIMHNAVISAIYRTIIMEGCQEAVRDTRGAYAIFFYVAVGSSRPAPWHDHLSKRSCLFNFLMRTKRFTTGHSHFTTISGKI